MIHKCISKYSYLHILILILRRSFVNNFSFLFRIYSSAVSDTGQKKLLKCSIVLQPDAAGRKWIELFTKVARYTEVSAPFAVSPGLDGMSATISSRLYHGQYEITARASNGTTLNSKSIAMRRHHYEQSITLWV